ncbi:MAG: TRC40/GET3/ArsA family transport-energizing ATPase [Candidatus Methanospirare jalkutatii]|nr:TRC40/GET3/ArsA family transport-energizing ATPase [Candidatus Methanospirare jalkutatii]
MRRGGEMRVIFYTGKGGSGKSVLSCATALRLATQGYDTLVMSSDPAHTISDAFERPVGSAPTKIVEHLHAIQVDALREVREKYGVIQEYVVSVFKARGLDEVLAYEIASLPNMTEFAAMLKIVDFVDAYDVVVLDTVPSGEMLKNIYLPAILGSIAPKLLRLVAPFTSVAKLAEPIVGVPAPSKEVIAEDLRLIETLRRLKDIILDRDVTSLRLVANPEAFSLQNLKRTYMLASLYNINVDLAIMNKVIPEDVKDPYFDVWKEEQRKYLEEAERAFYPLPVRRVRLYREEVKGLELLAEVADELFGDEDPAKIFFKGKALSVSETEKGLEIVVPLPFARSEFCEVERIGGELSVVVSTEIGEVRNFIPLPTAAWLMRLERAKLLNGELHIFFVRENDDGKK